MSPDDDAPRPAPSRHPVPVLDVGGTHVTAAVVDLARGVVVSGPVRRELDGAGTADELLGGMVGAARALGPVQGGWGVAMPSPFDYGTGIGRFTGVGKLESLNGVDVGAALTAALGAPSVVFLNDADAFGIGERVAGAGVGRRRVVGLTLGTGVGSAWIDGARPRTGGDDVPPEARVHLLSIDGAPLEETVSRRALRRAHARRTGQDVDVAEIAARADAGDVDATAVLHTAFGALGTALDPWLRAFGADVVVVGGSIARSWSHTGAVLAQRTSVDVVPAARPDDAALIGAAWWVVEQGTGAPRPA